MKLKPFHYSLIIFSIILVGITLSPKFGMSSVGSMDPATPLELKFAELSKAGTNFCAGPDIIDMVKTESLQGSCCSPMDFHGYAEQIEGLKKYSHMDKIPQDPYDVPVSWAEEMLDYQKTITLTPDQQSIYDEAMKMSHEGGPCCCECWRWYAYEGLAKYLITQYEFNSHQIAEMWDLSDGCGGEGHNHGEGHDAMMQGS